MATSRLRCILPYDTNQPLRHCHAQAGLSIVRLQNRNAQPVNRVRKRNAATRAAAAYRMPGCFGSSVNAAVQLRLFVRIWVEADAIAIAAAAFRREPG